MCSPNPVVTAKAACVEFFARNRNNMLTIVGGVSIGLISLCAFKALGLPAIGKGIATVCAGVVAMGAVGTVAVALIVGFCALVLARNVRRFCPPKA